jgi:hypothetical protein
MADSYFAYDDNNSPETTIGSRFTLLQDMELIYLKTVDFLIDLMKRLLLPQRKQRLVSLFSRTKLANDSNNDVHQKHELQRTNTLSAHFFPLHC